MHSEGKKDFEMSYVYEPQGGGGFKSIHLSLEVTKNHLIFTMFTDEVIENDDLNIILNKLQKETFDKMKYQILLDFETYLNCSGKVYRVEFIENQLEVKSVVPVSLAAV